jgi:hypothetical protein
MTMMPPLPYGRSAVPVGRPLSVVRGCSENTEADSAALARGTTASTEPRMERAVIGPAHRSLALTALFVRGSVLGNEWSIFMIGGERPNGHGEICAERGGASE